MQTSLFLPINQYVAVYYKPWYKDSPEIKVIQFSNENTCKIFDPVGSSDKLILTGYWLQNPEVISTKEFYSRRNKGEFFEMDYEPIIEVERGDFRTGWHKTNNKEESEPPKYK